MELGLAQMAALEKPFEPSEHKILRGNPYLRKDAIRRRLSQVDPGWSITPPHLLASTDTIVVMAAQITICGVTRGSVGTGIINRTDKHSKPLSDYNLAREIAKAHKTAASDLLPRCAQQFNVGAYLKNDPPANGFKDIADFAKWLQARPVEQKHTRFVEDGDEKAVMLTQFVPKSRATGAMLGNVYGHIKDTDKPEIDLIRCPMFMEDKNQLKNAGWDVDGIDRTGPTVDFPIKIPVIVANHPNGDMRLKSVEPAPRLTDQTAAANFYNQWKDRVNILQVLGVEKLSQSTLTVPQAIAKCAAAAALAATS